MAQGSLGAGSKALRGIESPSASSFSVTFSEEIGPRVRSSQDLLERSEATEAKNCGLWEGMEKMIEAAKHARWINDHYYQQNRTLEKKLELLEGPSKKRKRDFHMPNTCST